jgi:hypothetical protein
MTATRQHLSGGHAPVPLRPPHVRHTCTGAYPVQRDRAQNALDRMLAGKRPLPFFILLRVSSGVSWSVFGIIVVSLHLRTIRALSWTCTRTRYDWSVLHRPPSASSSRSVPLHSAYSLHLDHSCPYIRTAREVGHHPDANDPPAPRLVRSSWRVPRAGDVGAAARAAARGWDTRKVDTLHLRSHSGSCRPGFSTAVLPPAGAPRHRSASRRVAARQLLASGSVYHAKHRGQSLTQTGPRSSPPPSRRFHPIAP